MVDRGALATELRSSAGNKAQALRVVAEDADLSQVEFNKAFMPVQYFGYLRRNPDEPPDHNFVNWQFWVGRLNEFNGNFIQAEMFKALLDSIEYRKRFSQ